MRLGRGGGTCNMFTWFNRKTFCYGLCVERCFATGFEVYLLTFGGCVGGVAQ